MLDILVSDMTSLLADLEQLEGDLKSLAKGKAIVYAPDFSELYSLVNPLETREEFRIFSDDSIEECGVAQQHALNRLLHSQDVRTTLLPPYQAELVNWSRHRRNKIQQDIAELAKRASVEIKQITSTPRFLRISQLAENFANLSEAETNEIVDFFATEAGRLVVLLEYSRGRNFGKLKRVFGNPNFMHFTELSEFDDHDPDIYKEWLDALTRLRKRETPYATANDALAVSLVSEFNRGNSGTKIRIVTRSKTMAHQARQQPRTANGAENIIRHSRVFSVLGTLDLKKPEQALTRISEFILSIKTFIRSYDARKSETPIDGDEYSEDIASIKSLWHQGSQITTSLSPLDLNDSPGDWAEEVDRIDISSLLEIIGGTEGLVAGRDALRRLLMNRVSRIIAQIELEYRNLSWQMHTEGSLRRRALSKNVRVYREDDKIVFTSWQFYSPYSLKCSSARARDLQQKLAEFELFDLQEVSDWFDQSPDPTDPQSIYETHLIMSFLFCTLGDWEIAHAFAEIALINVDRRSKLKIHEALFIQAVCKSRGGDGFQDPVEAIELIDRAEKILGKPDPRYDAERSSIYFRFSARFPEISGKAAVSLARSSLERADPNEIGLKLTLINNLCFYFADIRPNTKKARLYLHQLEKVIEEEKVDSLSTWPNLVDTIVWTRWKLQGGSLSDKDTRLLVEQLNELLDSNRHLRASLRHVREHIEVINAALGR